MRYVWRRGATFTFGLEVVSGDVAGDEVVRCVLKAADPKTSLPPGDAADELVEFDVAFEAATDDDPARWMFTGSSTDGEGLAAGLYVADARIEIDGVVVQTASVQIKVAERVTEGV